MLAKPINDTVRFATELAALTGLLVGTGRWIGGGAGWLLGAFGAVAAAAVWGRWVAPRAEHRLTDPGRLAVEGLVFGAATAAIAAGGHPVVAGVFAAVVAVNVLLDRTLAAPAPAQGADARRARREAVVLEHMQSENVQEWQRTMATFSRPRYELPDGRVFDGAEAVMGYWIDGRSVVPDQRNELIELTHLDDDDQVMIEFWLRGTPTTSGRPFERRLWALFTFDADDRMTNERVYLEPPTAAQIAGRVTPDGRSSD